MRIAIGVLGIVCIVLGVVMGAIGLFMLNTPLGLAYLLTVMGTMIAKWVVK